MIDRPKPTVDRSRIEAMVREALKRDQGAGAAERPVESAGALLISPDRGVNVGEPYDPPVMARLLASTPARVAVGRVGPRYHTNTMLRFRADHAAAKDAVMSEVDPELLARLGMFEVASKAPDKA
ncbi:MAG TPA: ethanolamine ammonia-lyase light chain EutC, partial [Polyangia bacterium]|nr:ethanolamine ammonia-lyase light chain EutC [Polyangia bacterium]